MSDLSGAYGRILREMESKLCSGNEADREREWRNLMRLLRRQGFKPEDALYAIRELLDNRAGRGMEYHGAKDDCFNLPQVERMEIERQYRKCLDAAKMEFPYLFHIDVINVPARVADLRFAARAGEPLPGLNENQRSIAKSFGIPAEKYQQEVQAKLYGEEWHRMVAERFWDLVKQAGEPYRLEPAAVVYDVAAGKFYCELRCEGITQRAPFAAEVISAPIEHGDKEGIARAKEAVEVWLEEILGRLAPTRP
jgi:hypothetical protein